MERALFIADDHTMIRKGLATWFEECTEWTCAGQASSKDELIASLEELCQKNSLPAVLVTDINLNGSDDGFEIIREVKEKWPQIKIAAYSMYESAGMVQKALSFGASGYVSKTESEENLLKCVEDIFCGKEHVEKSLTESVKLYNTAISALTKREKQTLELLLKRKTNVEISDEMGINLHVAGNYISRVCEKMGVMDRNDLVKMFGEK